MQRRQFLRGLGAAGASTWLSACARSFQLRMAAMVATGPKGTRWDPDGIWHEAAAYARWTPSPHNIQPWRLRLTSETTADLLVDPNRRLPNTDQTSAFTLMSLAMFAEHLSLAVAPRGRQIVPDFVPCPLDYGEVGLQRVATLRLEPAPAADAAAARDTRDLLLVRKTSRLPYDGTSIADETMRDLAAIGDADGFRLQWSHEPTTVHDVLDLNRRALFTDLDDAITRTELRRWIRPTDDEAERTRDGLWAHCLRFPGWLLRDFFDHHEHWRRGVKADLCGRLLMRGMHGTRTVAWWSGPFEEPSDWLRAGRVMGRQWLAMTRLGIHLHPFGSVVTNPTAHRTLLAQLGAEAPRDTLWLLARLGHSNRPPRSYRLDAGQLFLSDAEAA